MLIQNNGGLKLWHFETKIQSLQLSWVKRLTYSSNHKWKDVPRKYFACINLKTYFDYNLKLLNSEEIPKFYLDIHNMKYFKQKPETIEEITDQSLCLNEYIKIKKSMYILKTEKSKGFTK